MALARLPATYARILNGQICLIKGILCVISCPFLTIFGCIGFGGKEAAFL